jgi:hypothetical protein
VGLVIVSAVISMVIEKPMETAKMSVIDIFVVSNLYLREKSRSIGFFTVSIPVFTGMTPKERTEQFCHLSK